jgi:hypothetical protein
MARLPIVAAKILDWFVESDSHRNDPRFGVSWALNAISCFKHWEAELQMHAPNLEPATRAGSIRVVVIDGGTYPAAFSLQSVSPIGSTRDEYHPNHLSVFRISQSSHNVMHEYLTLGNL